MARASRGGRGARERIIASARTLFYYNGIHCTGVEALAAHAHVSKRTLYQHFGSKDELVAAYLSDIVSAGGSRPEKNLVGPGSARDRLVAVFDPTSQGRFRGCPFHNAAVEAAGQMPNVRRIVRDHKSDFTARLIQTAAEANAADPAALGRELAVLFEGAAALATSMNDITPLHDARVAAERLIDSQC